MKRPDDRHIRSLKKHGDIYKSSNPVEMKNVSVRKLVDHLSSKSTTVVIHELPCTPGLRYISRKVVLLNSHVSKCAPALFEKRTARMKLLHPILG
jgi:hypothetical protein